MYGTKGGEILDPLKIGKGRLMELALMNEHIMYDLVQNVEARGGLSRTCEVVTRPQR